LEGEKDMSMEKEERGKERERADEIKLAGFKSTDTVL